jgi:hypothetical protein
MARRGWARSILAAVVAAATTAAAQLGLGYGLGVIAWAPTGADAPAPGAWSASLAWATWITATSVVVGAVVGDRSAGRTPSGAFVRAGWRVVVALAATIGGLISVPLVAVPARHAEVVDNYAPQLLAGVFAAAGAVLGLLVALIALVSRAVAANVVASAVWLWALAITAAIDAAASGPGLRFGQLGVWRFTEGGPTWRSFYIPGALLMLGAALLIGGLAAFPAAGRSDGRVGVAISGAFGPLLVAVAYVLASPQPEDAPTELMSAFFAAPYTVIAGLAGSVMVVLVGGVPVRSRSRPSGSGSEAIERRSGVDPSFGGNGGSLAFTGASTQVPARSAPLARTPGAHSATAAVPHASRAAPTP